MSSTDDGDSGSSVVAQNIVAIFHASFHPTKGNTIDWSLTASSDLDLSGVEFSVLPSGLHLVERDTVYFSHASHSGLAVFRRRPTRSKGHRGFRLASLGILLEESPRPRPWMHLDALKRLADEVYREADRREREMEDGEDLLGLGLGTPGDLTEMDFEPARKWIEARRADEKAPSVDVWSGWSDELDGKYTCKSTPTHHLPHLLRILGLSSLTLYKFVLSRRRVLIYTLPPVEVAGVLAWITADLCREHHMAPRTRTFGVAMPDLFNASAAPKEDSESTTSSPESPTVLGMVTLSDIDRLERESVTGRGWIACTTDAIFMERPQYYDLIIDLTTSTPSKASRPALYMSKPVPASSSGKKRKAWKLESVRFTWSDVKLWTELDRILKLDSSQTSSHAHAHPSAGACCLPKATSGTGAGQAGVWQDAFKLYEDVCLLCATLWMGLGTWRSNSRESFASRDADGRIWGAASAPGDEDWSLEGTHMRTLGMGIEGGPGAAKKKDKGRESETTKIRPLGLGIEGRPETRSRSRSYGHGLGHGRKASAELASEVGHGSVKVVAPASQKQMTTSYIENSQADQDQDGDEGAGEVEGAPYEQAWPREDAEMLRRQNIQTTLALLQTFHANTVFWLSKLREVVPPPSSGASSPFLGHATSRRGVRLGSGDHGREGEIRNDGEELDEGEEEEVTITARDLLALELGVLSELDARFVEWLVEAEGYSAASSSSAKRRVVVRRGWQELFGILLGLK